MSQILIGGKRSKVQFNVPIVDVPKWLRRGVSGIIGTMGVTRKFSRGANALLGHLLLG